MTWILVIIGVLRLDFNFSRFGKVLNNK